MTDGWGPKGSEQYRKKAREHMRKLRATKQGRLNSRKANNKFRNTKRPKFNEARRKWLNSAPSSRIADSTAGMLRGALRTNSSKSEIWDLLGVAIEDFKTHLERHWEPKMNWKNFGSEWCLFFITPKRTFDLTKKDELRRCFSLNNLKPAWKKDVVAKGGPYRNNRFLIRSEIADKIKIVEGAAQ